MPALIDIVIGIVHRTSYFFYCLYRVRYVILPMNTTYERKNTGASGLAKVQGKVITVKRWKEEGGGVGGNDKR